MGVQGQRVRVVETGQEFETVNECAEAINGIASRISECLSGRMKKHRGFTFERVGKRRRAFDFNQMDKFHAKKKSVKIIETGKTYESIAACARAINGQTTSIWKCLSGKQKTHLGFTFTRVE